MQTPQMHFNTSATCVEPLFAALLAMILLGQFLSVAEWVGFFIVLLSIFMFEKRAPKTG